MALPEGGSGDLFAVTADAETTLLLQDVRFEPDDLTIGAGEVFAISLDNRGSLQHDFTLKDLAGGAAFRYPGDVTAGAEVEGGRVHVPLNAKSLAELRLRIDRPGEYEFWCNVPGHRSAGMQGTILVR